MSALNNIPHIHAALMALYAEYATVHSKPWEFFEVKTHSDTCFKPLDHVPSWSESCEYRERYSKVIINGKELDAPIQLPIGFKDKYVYCLRPNEDRVVDAYSWSRLPDNAKNRLIERRVLFRTKEAAEAYLEAITSIGTLIP